MPGVSWGASTPLNPLNSPARATPVVALGVAPLAPFDRGVDEHSQTGQTRLVRGDQGRRFLEVVRDRRDLIADVGALANNRGGLLVLGVGTTIHQSARIEVATRILGIRNSHVNETRYLDLIRAHVQSLVRDVTVEAVASPNSDRRHSLALIIVQPQYDREKPFLVDRLVSDEDDRVTHTFGWPERSGDATYWHPLAHVQQLIAAGRQSTEPAVPIEDEVEADAVLAYELAELDERTPSFLIRLMPTPRNQPLPDFFGETLQSLRQWHPLRGAGFGFDTRWHQLTAAIGEQHLVVSIPINESVESHGADRHLTGRQGAGVSPAAIEVARVVGHDAVARIVARGCNPSADGSGWN